jgi:hypothetical protein
MRGQSTKVELTIDGSDVVKQALKYDRLGCFGVRFCLLSGSNI